MGTPTTLSSGSVIDACSTRYCSGVKARKILGYEPRIGIQEGIQISCEVGLHIHENSEPGLMSDFRHTLNDWRIIPRVMRKVLMVML